MRTVPVPQQSHLRLALAKLRRNRLAMSGLLIIVLISAAGALAPVLAPYDAAAINLADKLQPPSYAYPLGTDHLGRDIFTRMLHGILTSLYIPFITLLIVVVVGVIAGAAAGYAGGRTDVAIMGVTEVFLSFPSMLFAMVIAGLLGPGLVNTMVALSLVWWTRYVKVIRGIVLSLKEKEFIAASRSAGTRSIGIVVRHIFPNLYSTIFVMGTLDMGRIVLAMSGLSFLGLGVQPPEPEWGAMLVDGRNYMQIAPGLLLYPGLAIMLVTLAFNLLGEGLRDALDSQDSELKKRQQQKGSSLLQTSGDLTGGGGQSGHHDPNSSLTPEPALLRVEKLTAVFQRDSQITPIVKGISFQVHAGKILCLIGESGSGKSITALSVLGLLESPGYVVAGEVWLENANLRTWSEKQLRTIRGSDIAMIFQNPGAALNPLLKIGVQLVEAILSHSSMTEAEAKKRASASLRQAGLQAPDKIMDRHPFELSGGMKQRVMIAMAICLQPKVLIADEPTTALDVTVQAQILTELRRLRDEQNTGILLITHDIGVVAQMADEVAVMKDGVIVEYGDVQRIFEQPAHPYTQALLQTALRISAINGGKKL
ncbi:dipeptide/oligopeptide/nickel ABC transporter permease/ATP-binding protein [Paenibacillus sp. GCM10027626]|uniref:dipeptide/oligopeptide/nickel ABC transporter permease/ATP-binding protein n=1 Tax=Paenibacillus sp. GCM10027626 TaxID=3273411 RepID=UPI00363F80FD